MMAATIWRTSAHGRRFIKYCEGYREKAYLCSANHWTVGYGSRRLRDGAEVRQGDEVTLAIAEALLERDLLGAEQDVTRLYVNAVAPGVSPDQNVFDALVSFVYNLGAGALASSTRVLPAFLSGRIEDGAREMSAFTYEKASYKGAPFQNANHGLLVRRYGEGCLAMGSEWLPACISTSIALTAEPVWNETKQLWRDRIIAEKTTQWSAVWRVAQNYPLAGELPELEPEIPAPVVVEAKPASMPAVIAKAVPQQPDPRIGSKPLDPNTKMPEHVPYGIDPKAGLKPMESTERFVGAALMMVGTFLRAGMANGMRVTGVAGVATVGVLDMMKSPTNMAILVSAIAIGITAIGVFAGHVIHRAGLKKKKRGEATATQAMF